MKKLSESVRLVPGSLWLRAAAFSSVSIIVFLSLIPGRWQERTALPGPLEHFGAYLITAMIIGLATRRRCNPILLIVALSTGAGVLEVLQLLSPGRDPELVGFAGSAVGALVGAILVNWMRPK